MYRIARNYGQETFQGIYFDICLMKYRIRNPVSDNLTFGGFIMVTVIGNLLLYTFSRRHCKLKSQFLMFFNSSIKVWSEESFSLVFPKLSNFYTNCSPF